MFRAWTRGSQAIGTPFLRKGLLYLDHILPRHQFLNLNLAGGEYLPTELKTKRTTLVEVPAADGNISSSGAALNA